MRGGVGVARAPAFEPGQRVLFLLRAPNLDQRTTGDTPPGGLHARRLARLLLVLRRPWRIALTLALVARRELEQRRERAARVIDACMPIAERRETRGHRAQREVSGLAR